MSRAVLVMFLSASVAFVAVRGCGIASKSISEPAPTQDVKAEVCKLGTSC